jgi:Fe-S cluster assembly protein SufD
MTTSVSQPSTDSNAAERMLAAVAAGEQRGSVANAPWLAEQRQRARERFRALGLPTPRTEAWKYTKLSPLERMNFVAPRMTPDNIKPSALPTLGPANAFPHRFVFVDGRYMPHLSSSRHLPAGATLASLAEMLAEDPSALEPYLGRSETAEDQALFALNSASLADGFVLRLAPGADVEAPIHIVHLASGADETLISQPRNLILLGERTRATLVEQHVAGGSGSYFTNGVTEVALGRGAVLHHLRLQQESHDAVHVWQTEVHVGREASYESFALAEGARLGRNEIRAWLDGEEAGCRLNGIYLAAGVQHLDTTTVVEHRQPRGTSRETYKGILDDRGRGVFQGRTVVRPGAVKTDGHQLNRALLLSDHAEVDSKPELEIYADDVKCGHGAAAGALDEEALFYLRARGLAESHARAMLVAAFAGEVIDEIADPLLRDAASARVSNWIAKRQGG